MGDVDDRGKIPMTAEESAEVAQMVVYRTEDKVDGFIYNDSDIEGQGINRVPEL